MPAWVSTVLTPLDIFKNENKLATIVDYPCFVIHGKDDEVVPATHVEHIYNELKKKNKNVEKYFVDGCGHNDIELNRGDEYYEAIKNFIDNYIRTPQLQLSN